MRPLLAFLVLTAGNLALAEPPKLNIPPEIQAAGDYVTFTPETDAKGVSYFGLSGVDPFPPSILADRRTFALPVRGLPAGGYRFVAVGSLNDEHASQTFTVIVGQRPAPVPPPGPGPGPTPPPVPPGPQPDGELGLIKVSRDGAAAVPEFAAKAAQRKALADAQRAVASKLAAGGFAAAAAAGRDALANAVSAERRAANNAAATAAQWGPWGSGVSARLTALFGAGKLNTPADWQAALEEIALGLD